MAANRQLWGDRATDHLHLAAARVTCPVTLIHREDDPRPWTASDSLLAALPAASRIVLKEAGHVPGPSSRQTPAVWSSTPCGPPSPDSGVPPWRPSHPADAGRPVTAPVCAR